MFREGLLDHDLAVVVDVDAWGDRLGEETTAIEGEVGGEFRVES